MLADALIEALFVGFWEKRQASGRQEEPTISDADIPGISLLLSSGPSSLVTLLSSVRRMSWKSSTIQEELRTMQAEGSLFIFEPSAARSRRRKRNEISQEEASCLLLGHKVKRYCHQLGERHTNAHQLYDPYID